MAFLPFPSAWSTKQKGKSVPSVSSTPVSYSFRHVLSWSCRSLQCFWEQPGWNAKGRKLLICSQLIISQWSWFFSDWMHFAMDSDGWAPLTRPLQKPVYGTHRCRMRKKNYPITWLKYAKRKEMKERMGQRACHFSLISKHFSVDHPFCLPMAERQHWILRRKTRIFTNKG